MSVFRPRNINRRLVGTAATDITLSSGKGSPGNAGQIGPTKKPYLNVAELIIGSRCTGGATTGVFKLNESRCGVIESCKTLTDYKGFFICCGPSTTKWFVAPSCTQTNCNWYCRSCVIGITSTCMGNCGWFIPSTAQLQNPGFNCRLNWDSFCSACRYWSNNDVGTHYGGLVSFSTGQCVQRGSYATNTDNKNNSCPIRAFRCTST